MYCDPPSSGDAKSVVGIAACLLLVIAAFSPWMSVQAGGPLTLAGVTLSSNASNFGLAVSSVLALALLFARNRWALIVPSVYGAVEFLKIMVVWLIAQVSNAPAPPARLPLFPAFDLRPGPSPDLAILVLGAVLGIAASWGDFRAALRFVMKGDRERHEASE